MVVNLLMQETQPLLFKILQTTFLLISKEITFVLMKHKTKLLDPERTHLLKSQVLKNQFSHAHPRKTLDLT